MTDLEPTNLRGVLEFHAGARPSAPALLSPGHPSLSYSQLLAAADQVRLWLASFGLDSRSRIAVVLPTGLPLALANITLACTATVIPLHPGLTPPELEALAHDARANAVLGQPGDDVVTALARQLGVPALPFELSGFLQAPADPSKHLDHRASPAPGDTAFVLFTSGTSGKPKRVPLTHQQILASARNIGHHLAMTQDDCGLLVMPLFHAHGLIGGLLTPLVAGSPVVCTPGFDADNFVQWITRFVPTWYTAAPSIHQAIADLGARLGPAWPEHRLRFVRSASSALSSALLGQLEALWKSCVIESYGMTESATQMASNPLPPGTRRLGSVGPAAGAELRVIGKDGYDQPCGSVGRIVARGPALFSGYEDAPELNREAFHDGWFITGDLGWTGTDGHIYITGRASEIINRGGEKIAPHEIEQALLALPAVAQAVAFPAPHPTLGEDVHAAVVLTHNASADPRALRRALFGALADFKIPACIHLLEKIPTGVGRKVQRRRMHEQLQFIPRLQPAATGPRAPLTPLQARMAALFAQILRRPLGDTDANFLAMGGDSLSAARLALAVNRDCGVAISVAHVLAAPSVTEFAALVQAAIDDVAARGSAVHAASGSPGHADNDADGDAPLSFAQEGLWFVDQLGGGNPAYNIHSVTRLHGRLDVDRLQQSLGALLARHAGLRTGFHATDSAPVQRVIPPALAAERFRLRQVALPERADEAAHIAAVIAEPFDLSQAPLLRAALLRISGDEHVLVLVAHHIVVDGWSMTLLHRDLGQCYALDAPALPGLPLSLRAHARLQRQHFERGDMQAALDFWRKNLRDVHALEVPADRPRPAKAGYEGKTHDFRIEPALATALRRLAKEQHVTLFTAMLAAFQALLLRYTGQTDIAIGVPVAGRDDPRLFDTVGHFVNTVVVRADLQSEPGFVELIRRNRQALFEVLTHQHMPFERLVADLGPQRDPGRNPLYQVSFSLENFAHRSLELDGLRSERLGVHSECAKFDLSLTVTETGPGAQAHLDAEIEYRTDLFTPHTIERMAAHFGTLLAAMVEEPARAVTRLPLMDAAEQQRMLVEWNGPALAPTHPPNVHALFRAQARRTPEAVALRFGEQTMRYARLDALSDRLAHELRRRGVCPGSVVGLCMPRSFGLVVGLLALLKAGGTYLPLDPEHPPERLRAMLADAAPRFVLADTQPALRLRELDAMVKHAIIEVPANGGTLSVDAVPAVQDLTRPEHIAYLIFTSGSTGTPKAAQLTHGGLANHVQWMQHTLDLVPEDRVLQKTSISFDASICEFFAPLACGAQIVLAQPEVHRDMQQLAATLHEDAISVVQFVPSEMRVILDEAPLAQCTSLRYVLCGGEALDRDLALAFRRCLPAARLGNFYGPTETTIDSAWFEVGDAVPERTVVPIGRPVANAQLYVLDAHLQPQPVNVPGELYVGGLGVGRGYLNRPDLTAERFVPNPFRPGERMYRTGDLARWLDDGVVEFIGRDDQQVKLRGFRVELGEIEAGLNACRGVKMCAVLLREDVPGQRELVAYVTLDATTGANAHDLRTQLRARLPQQMVPATFVFLPQMPRLANGKVDRRKLPRPESGCVTADEVAPRSPLEEGLQAIWQHVLGKSGFGIRTNFFDLGGHSLLATQIVSRVRALFRIELPVRSIFEHPTIEGLARLLDGHPGVPPLGESAALAPLAAVSRAQPSMVSFSQRRIWLLHAIDPRGAAYNMCEALRLRGPLQRAALRRALDQMALRHEAFSTTFESGESEPVAIIGKPQPAVLTEVDGRDWPEAERDAQFERQAAGIAAQPFDLAHGPLHRFILVRLADDDHALVMVMHHMIGDGWSWSVLLRELQALYNAAVLGKEARLLARAIDFVDFASWQREHIDDGVLAAQTRYWLRQLAGWGPLELPADTPATQRLSSQGARVRIDLSPAWVERVQGFSAQHSASPFMSLLAAFQFLLSRYCGQDDVAVGTPIAGRTRVEAEELVGSLINTLVLRCQVRPEQDFRALLAQVRETSLSAFAHQDVPLDYLVERLRRQAPGTRVPELRVMFNVLNARREPVQLEGLDVQFLSLSLGATQFDLGLTVDIEGERAMFLTYSTELFSAATAQALLDNYAHLMERLIASPDVPLQGLAVPGPRQLALLASWNHTDVDRPRGQTVHGLLSSHCASDAMALRQLPGASLHYAQLWSRVHRLTHALRARGVQRGTRVGLCLERDPTMVVAQLAVLMAGAAYVPLDPAYPRQRLHDMALDAGLVLLLTGQQKASHWEELELPTMLLDSPVDPTAHPDTAPPPDSARDAGPDDPAYVIYTSGSTGKPKGVAVPHRAVVNFLLSMQREPGLRAGDVLLAVTTLSFDISVLELLLPLSVGATVVLATREQASNGLSLNALLDRSEATVMQATPSTWRLLIDAGWMGGPAFKALIGGESLSLHMAQALSCRAGEVWNMYGPTETTVWSTCWKVPRPAQAMSIGRPIANTRLHVLDEHGNCCPVGVSGEIFIGGDGVALGYLARPELTADRFVPEPFGTAPGARMYKTGDRGRWRHDGTLEHQGRLDFQVKLRGHRIEPGEIEAQLQAHPEVSQCLVMAREDRPGDARLVAYVVTADGTCDAPALREHLRATLPDYMLPQHFVALQVLPLLPNGKINRAALPPPSRETRTVRSMRPGHRSPAEGALARLWADVLDLQVEDIEPHDNFFDLGGDSLKAARIVILFEREWGVRMESRRLLFETLSQLASGVDVERVAEQMVQATPLSEGGTAWWKRFVEIRR
ncbi:amino acid adenylation domain-containing protein [Variovorax sp. J22R133]|uniref:non-ribosomal peptide synthetase n=1 Tax=Variovorax brevis TaxID=3053503 RepID=UPI002575ED98|nr:non-ribosomal peptide synthetase [Variovorax sp. J22R133]MDM0116965.1 amino acid adenylation domain-containing protein [Variovorax sp. J22R133]